jgi:uncharacterized membrane protein YjjB (DUF3815 family)
MTELILRFVLRDFIFGILGALGFALIINVPKKSIVVSSILGGFAYMLYDLIYYFSEQMYFAVFAASVFIAIYSELLARKFKMPAIIFILPGIVALVPGVGLYKTILRLIDNDFFGFLKQGAETIFIACAIASAIAVVNILIRAVYNRIRRIRKG